MSNFDVTEQKKKPTYLPKPVIEEEGDGTGDSEEEEEDHDNATLDWGTSVVVARRVDRTDPSFAASSGLTSDDDDEWRNVPVFHSVGVIQPSHPSCLFVAGLHDTARRVSLPRPTSAGRARPSHWA